MVRLEAAAIYVAANMLILLILAVIVVRSRQRHKIALGDGGNRAMERAIRAHANAAEQIPAALVGLVLMALLNEAVPENIFHAAGISLTAGRAVHGIALNVSTLNFGRILGMVLTWIGYVLIIGALIYAGLAAKL